MLDFGDETLSCSVALTDLSGVSPRQQDIPLPHDGARNQWSIFYPEVVTCTLCFVVGSCASADQALSRCQREGQELADAPARGRGQQGRQVCGSDHPAAQQRQRL